MSDASPNVRVVAVKVRNQMHKSAISVQFVPGQSLNEIHPVVATLRNQTQKSTISAQFVTVFVEGDWYANY
eukprot:2740878-Rhodomonas_salina.3